VVVAAVVATGDRSVLGSIAGSGEEDGEEETRKKGVDMGSGDGWTVVETWPMWAKQLKPQSTDSEPRKSQFNIEGS
jgi:hypothetical protein